MAATAIPLQVPRPKLTPVSPIIRIPAPGAKKVDLRFADVAERDHFGEAWQIEPLSTKDPCIFEVDVNTLGLDDGVYEYDFIVDGNAASPVADPFAQELEKFGGYRSTFTIHNGKRVGREFGWDDELPQAGGLPNNNEIVIYEMPVRWMSQAEQVRQVDLGTFEKAVFEHLDDLANLGINAIELLPVQDSADTLNWGYGTRFFFAPDWDLGVPLDMKFFIKRCHQRGIRVILDVVMNHSRECPLETVADDWYYLKKGSTEENTNGVERNDYDGRLFRYAKSVNNTYYAREFQYTMAEFWIREYHIDGFRIDEFKGINNWDFLQTFRERAWNEHNQTFPDRPFIVIAEDSWRRPQITDDHAYNNKPLVDAMWNFDFRDQIRELLDNNLSTAWGDAPRRDRIASLISGQKVWDENHSYRSSGFSDLSKAVNYITSHDVEAYLEQRLMNFHMMEILRYTGVKPNDGESEVDFIQRLVDNIATQSPDVQAAHGQSLERIGSTFALMLTSAGIPMFLAGEEFADIHDLDHYNWRLKQADPVDWERINLLGHKTLRDRVGQLIALRTEHPALQRNEVEFFYFHPTIDDNNGMRVFAYCRTGGQLLGKSGQVVVVANTGPDNFANFNLPWFWPIIGQLEEHGAPQGGSSPQLAFGGLSLSLAPFQVRVFST